MKYHILFVGVKFIYNKALKNYILRKIEQEVDFISSITFFKENDSSLFLYLEEELNTQQKIIIVTTKHSFTTVSKLICTVTSDNLVYQENILIPQKASTFKERSYLLEYKESELNVLHIDEMQRFPELLIESNKDSFMKLHIFEEDKESLELILSPLAQMYDVTIEIIPIIEGWMEVEVHSRKYGNLSQFTHSVKQLLPLKALITDDVVAYIIKKLEENGKKISFAESCTGGLLAYYFVKHNGTSLVFDGSLVTYANELKENWLAIDGEVIQTYGAVSQEVVEQMSDGVMNVSHADYAISISGIAGDGGGTPEKPCGTVHIGVRNEKNHREIALHLKGDRNYVQHQSALNALKQLLLSDQELFF